MFSVFLGMVGLLFVILGVVVTVVFDPLVNSFIFKELMIRNNSDMYKKWKDPPIVPHLQVYFFNVTNKEEFLEGDKPVLQEVGPYCYSVSYETQKFYFFERNSSVGSEDDIITTLNIPMMSAVSQWRFAARLAKLALSSMLEVLGTKPFVTKTVQQLMWGYDDPLLKIAKDIIPPDKRLPYEQFGFFIKKNGSTDGLLNVYTGVDDMTQYSTINTFNYKWKLHYWKTDACSPTLVSWPHFYQADPKYRRAVIGLNPDPDRHAMFIDVAPRTGTPLRAQARLQINIAIPYVPEVYPAANLREMIFPVLWFADGVAELPEDLIDLLRLGENTPAVAKLSMLLAFFILGSITVIFVVIAFLTTHYNLPVPYFNPSYTHKEGKTTKVNNTECPVHKADLSGHVNTLVSSNPEHDDA
ncbi:Scavenger receptor class B member 1 [Chionoecetes opilio]|uniref:Scavenger receptor class B member 1 n=1 Tax=Chionoecetes opilio TaxID=41210 RepID=A0A8J4YAC8_CHIOP|nr:Scavenger receptor class B member 1 [Chionoecetes opilio]